MALPDRAAAAGEAPAGDALAGVRPTIVVLDDWEDALGRLADWSALRARADVRIHRAPLAGEALREALAQADALALNRDRTPLDAARIARMPRLRCVVFTGPRNRRIDYAALRARGIPVGSTEAGPGRESTCEHTWALILACTRRLEPTVALMRGGRWRPDEAMPLADVLHGETLGLIGLGGIGGRVAAVGRAFGMRVLAWSPNMTPERAAAHGAEAVPLDALLAASKVVSLHLVTSDATRRLIDRDRLARMRRDAVLVNTSRGDLVDTEALLDALEQRRLGAAALDVFEVEPVPADARLRRVPGLLATPHTGFVAQAVLARFAAGVVASLEAWLNGRPLPHPVDETQTGAP